MIALESYYSVFLYSSVTANILLALFILNFPNMRDHSFLNLSYYIGVTLFIFLTLLVATRPISYYFGDMGNYYAKFQDYVYYYNNVQEGDIAFEGMMYFFAKYFDAKSFFFFCSILYFLPLYFAYKRIFTSYWPIAFILSTITLDFYGFAVNGIRNGIAAHIFLLALALPKRYSWSIVLIAIGFHSSLLIPAFAYLATTFYSKVKTYYHLWATCFILSLFYSGFGDLFQTLGFTNAKLDIYLNAGDTYSDQFSKVGYRYDFVLYGFIPVIVSYYYIYKRQFKNDFYNMLVCIYLFSNSFFLLVNEIPFSNRFAYLSWFMMITIMMYPIFQLHTKKDSNIFAILAAFLLATNFISNT